MVTQGTLIGRPTSVKVWPKIFSTAVKQFGIPVYYVTGKVDLKLVLSHSEVVFVNTS